MFVDSNVLYSRTARDWLGMLYLAQDSPPFAVCWSDDVLSEAIYHLRKKHPSWEGGKISRIQDHIANTFEVGRITDFSVDGTYGGEDQGDAHMHAAALACEADILLTFNVKHFNWTGCDLYYDVMTPDDFFVLVDDSAPGMVRAVAGDQRDYWLGRSREADLPARLVAASCPKFSERVRTHLQAMAGINIPHHRQT